jgi:excisionase family DNA binding protein
MTEDLLSASEVAPLLGVSQRTVYRMALRGDLPYGRIGNGAFIFDRRDIVAYHNAAKRAAAAAAKRAAS